MLTPVDIDNRIDKHNFKVPFLCGAKDIGVAFWRISEVLL